MVQTMARREQQVPVAPIVLTALLLAVVGLYLTGGGDGGPALAPPAEGMVRVVSWDVRGPDGAKPHRVIAGTLGKLNADVVALCGLTDGAQAVAAADGLEGDWRLESLPGVDGGHLAVLVGPGLSIVSYHLIPTSAGDALALTLCRPGRAVFRVVCLQAAATVRDLDVRHRYLAGVLTWCTAHPAAVQILAGGIDVGPQFRSQLAQRFAAVCTEPGAGSELRVGPPETPVVGAGFVGQDGDSGVAGRLAVADVAVP